MRMYIRLLQITFKMAKKLNQLKINQNKFEIINKIKKEEKE